MSVLGTGGLASIANILAGAETLAVGMRYFHINKNKYHNPIINVDKLWSLLGSEVRETAAKDTSKAPVLDVTKYGYFKVVGNGHIPAQPLIVKAKLFTKRAEKKILEAGGACLLTA
ncbi:unnamed protein product [Ostreobium quekettii]|uniref:Large ribosomal subunit protein uL15/eL18 domain-containing protein n=1 Tax=Ostreobium quekettii TaxID=121088 RepID=A0A8S1IRK3_9CHLO|nr:unnamed protein product [Ostreobium quekettii]|eukprot:evm.model.scf_1811EXC.1 EVM.evm.TU.scf_1811EXC.1   scf_1811EXC:2128-3206(-)